MRVQVAIPEQHVSKDVLDAALESVTRLNEQMIAAGEVPSFERGLHYGVKWRPEPPGDEHFDSADRVIKRGWGDCDDLAPWHAASLRASGEDPEALAIVKRSGPKRWHAIVQRGDGSIDDPSKRAGMAPNVAPGVFGVAGAAVPMMIAPPGVEGVGSYIVRPQIALRPVFGQFQARADLPWHWREHMIHDEPSSEAYAMTALHTAPVAQTALVGAIEDVCRLAHANGVGEDEHIDRLCAIADALEGAGFHELEAIYGSDHAEAASAVVGSFFGKIARGIGKVVKKVGPSALSFVPGVGPLAAAGLKAGMHFIPTGGGKKRRSAPAPQQAQQQQPAPFARSVQPSPAGDRQPGLAAMSSSGRQIIINVH